MSFFARPLALVILVALLLGALFRGRVAGFGGTDLDKIAALALAVIGAACWPTWCRYRSCTW